MSTLFFDSSALVKRYLTEAGSAWIDTLVDPRAGYVIAIATITQVEVAAALASRHRTSGGITRQERDDAVNLLAQHCTIAYQMVPLTERILAHALDLTQNHRLRGYDAVQLAAALATSAVLRGITLVTADRDMIMAAQSEGMAADDPNMYP